MASTCLTPDHAHMHPNTRDFRVLYPDEDNAPFSLKVINPDQIVSV